MARGFLFLLVLAACVLLGWVLLGGSDAVQPPGDPGTARLDAADPASMPTQAVADPAPSAAPMAAPASSGPRALAPKRVLFLEGYVLEAASGAPIVGARVSAEWPGPPRSHPRLPMRLAEAVGAGGSAAPGFGPLTRPRVPSPPAVITDEQGRFRWMVDRRGGTDPSRCELFATAPGYVPACAPRLPADRPLRIRLQRAVPFEVHVLDDAGSPIQGAIVRVEPSDATGTWCGHAASETSDVEGKAVLDGLGPDVLALRADHPDYMPLRLRRVDPSQTPLEVRLRRAARVEFVLRTADGSTPRGAMLEWTGERDGVHGRVEIPLTVAPLAGAGDRAPRSGPLRLPADAGRLHLSISAPGFATWSRALDLRPGDPPNTLDVSLAR